MMFRTWIVGSLAIVVPGFCLAEPRVQQTAPSIPEITANTLSETKKDESQAKIMTRLNELLDTFETVPTEAEWKALGQGAAPMVRSIALDNTLLVNRRKKAISALVYFGDDETKTLLKGLVQNEKESHRIRGQAALSLSLVLGESGIEVLTPLLSAENFRLRESVIKAFARIDSKAVVKPLQARLSVEPKVFLKEAIEKIISTRQNGDKAAGEQ